MKEREHSKEYQRLEQAIATLEAQRDALGNEVVEAALGPIGQALIDDSSGWAQIGTLEMPRIGISIDRSTTYYAVVNTTTEITVFSTTIPANWISNTRAIRYRMLGYHYNNFPLSYKAWIRIRFGSTLVSFIEHAFYGAGASIDLDFHLCHKGVTNAQFCHTEYIFGDSGVNNMNNGTVFSSERRVAQQHQNIAEDATTALAFSCTFQWSVAAVGAGLYHLDSHLELI